MKFGPVPLADAVGRILGHNLLGPGGHKIMGKGHVLSAADVENLRALNLESVIVATLDATDLNENEAAQRVGQALAGAGLRLVTPGVGRANLVAEVFGPLRINVPVLDRLNNIDEGITIATLRQHSLVRPGDLAALVKIIPFGMSAARVLDVETIAREAAPIMSVRPLRVCSTGLIVTGPDNARERLLAAFEEPVRRRIEALDSRLDSVSYVPHQTSTIAATLTQQRAAERDLVIVAGVSAIIDRDDVVPTALREAGGDVAHYGVPVDPGSLLMLGYIDSMPVIGAPGCIKSLKTNIIDWILPRLLAGERLTRADFVVMGHGGLLDDISERPMPRQHTGDSADLT